MPARKQYPTVDEINQFGVHILWTRLFRLHNLTVPVICRCGKTRNIAIGELLAMKGKGLCIACSKKEIMTGKNHWRWNGGVSISGSGYRLIRPSALPTHEQKLFASMVGRNGLIREHRLIVARCLGRPLRSDEHVHHIDGNKLNNQLDNLQIVSNSDHQITGHNQIKELTAEVDRLRSILRRFNIPF